MSDTSTNRFSGRGDTADRTAFVPDPAMASPEQGYTWWDTDTETLWAYDFVGIAWVEIGPLSTSGDVVGPASVTADRVVLFDGTTGKLIKQAAAQTGSGAPVFGTSPTLTTPALGTPSALVLTSATGLVTAGIVDANVTNAKLADMNSLTVKVRAANSAGVPSDVAITDGHTAKRVGTAIASGGFGPASMQVLTAGTGATYTVPAGVYRIKAKVQGGGGGGGGGDGTSSCMSAGGGSGGYSEKIFAVIPGQTCTYTIGGGGAGGAAGPNTGSTGGTTTFNLDTGLGGVAVVCAGGVGGASQTTGTSIAGVAGGAGGTATGGDLNITGGLGGYSVRQAANSGTVGQGAPSLLGYGGAIGPAATNAAPNGYGGGGGGMWQGGGADITGSAGAPGVIIVEEYN